MKTLICKNPFEFEYGEAEVPVAGPGQTLLKVKRIGICGTDLHAFEGTQPYFSYPRILGHELATEIVQTDAEGFTEGESVTFIPYFNCGTCVACRRGFANCCTHMQVCGVHVDGGMREYLTVPSQSLVKANGLGFEELALVEPLAIGAHGIRRAGVEKDEWVLVIGAGPIGLGTMQFAAIAGGKVIAMDTNQSRLDFCKTNLDIAETINPLGENATEKLAAITNGEMATVVIDATGNLKAINNAFQYIAHSGRFVLIGLQKENISFSHPEFHKRETTLMSSRNAYRADFESVVDAMVKKQVNPLTYITHRVQFAEVQEKFASWLDPKEGVIKAMVEMA